MPPRIDNAPGLTWRPRKSGWEARWQCRTDLARRGYPTKSARLWFGVEPSEIDIAYIQSECQRYQADMIVWGRGGIPQIMSFDGTLHGLIQAYQFDQDSPYRKLRYQSRIYYETLCRRIEADLGNKVVEDITARDLIAWHRTFADQIPMGHACVGMFRILLTFGSTILADKTCRELRLILHDMRFPVGKARSSTLTAEQANLIRAEAHRRGMPSIALAQAFQFECMFRQKDVIGEWVPISEPGLSEVTWGNAKWLRGIRWDEINENFILKHVTSKRQKEVVVDLRNAPMVMDELAGKRADSGPIIVCEATGVPWTSEWFRRKWRHIANACGIPKDVRNMDSRAGAITEATEAGAELEHIKHAATHSDISMTQRYARGGEEKAAGVLKKRVAFRNAAGTKPEGTAS